MNEDLRRISRVSVCCRVVGRDRYGVWTGVTEDISLRGCQIVTPRLLRSGTNVTVTLSSDLFPEELELIGEAVWATPTRLGVNFVDAVPRADGLSLEAWLRNVVEHGELPESQATGRVVPSVRRVASHPLTTATARNGRLVRTLPAVPAGDVVVRLPIRRA